MTNYNSLEDFLISSYLSVDGHVNSGVFGATSPVKGREIEATILFADISGFSGRTLSLSSTETLIFANNFFSWISTQALRGSSGIVDKYIGDEIMIVFSEEFGSDNPFIEAIETARYISEFDVLGYVPHMGIASGIVTIGYVGTPIKYSCSVYGAPVTLAARCANIKQIPPDVNTSYSSSIFFPAAEWKDREFNSVFSPRKDRFPDGTIEETPHSWKKLNPRTEHLKNIGDVEILEIINGRVRFLSQSAEERAKESLRSLAEIGRYWPRMNNVQKGDIL